MAEHAHAPGRDPGRMINGLLAVCLAVAVGALGYIAASAPTPPQITEESFVLTPPRVDPERLAADRAKHYASVDLTAAQEEIAALVDVVKKANELQFQQADAKAVHDTQILTSHHANEVITKIGMDAFVQAGQPMYDQCAAAFTQLLGAVQSGALSAEAASKDPGEAHAAYRSWCGDAFAPLVRSGVLTPDGRWADDTSGPLVFEIMNRFRWASLLDLRRPPWEQLSPYEYEILTRWRASIRSVPIERRVQWVVSAQKALPKFIGEELIGSLLYEDGDLVGALGAYEEACDRDPRDAALRRKCEFLRARVGSGAAAH